MGLDLLKNGHADEQWGEDESGVDVRRTFVVGEALARLKRPGWPTGI